jgi:bis(5'-nucleosidyl)-tetraphosphatase
MSGPARGIRKSTRQERSAGVILYRSTSGGRRLFLLLDYGRYWDYPKGHVERGEDDRSAALRELREETGLDKVQFADGFTHEMVYYFCTPRGALVRKTVVFFLASTRSSRVQLSEEHVGCEWLAAEEAMERLKYATAKQALAAALEYLEARATPIGPSGPAAL